MATQDQLINRTLSILNAVGAGQTASAEDVALVTAQIPVKLSELAARKIIYIPDQNDFDDAALQWLAVHLANDLGADFGRALDPNAAAFADQQLRLIQISNSTDYPTLKANFF